MNAAEPPDGPGADWRVPVATGPVRASVPVPGSKSITNRALVLAALASGPTVIRGPLIARDTELMAAALRALGCRIRERSAAAPAGHDGADRIQDRAAAARYPDGQADGQAGSGPGPASAAWLTDPGEPGARSLDIDVGNAGTVLRFVPPVAALTAAAVSFRGDARVSQRPVAPLLAALRELGAAIDDGGRGAVPFTVRGTGSLPGGAVTLDASSSSQLISGLLLAAPRFDKGAEVRHEGPRVPSAPHLDMTMRMLRACGADAESSGARAGGRQKCTSAWRVRPGPIAPGSIDIEPDLSAALPFLAAALVTGGEVTIPGWPADSLQPTERISELLSAAGAVVARSAGGLTVRGSGRINGLTADLGDVGELVPVLTALAALASGPSQFTGIGHLRRHESDRLAGLAAEIGKLGGAVTELPDGLLVQPRRLRADGTALASHDDHRMVMAAAVLGLVVPGLRVRGAATVGKTFPGFTRAWAQMLATSR